MKINKLDSCKEENNQIVESEEKEENQFNCQLVEYESQLKEKCNGVLDGYYWGVSFDVAKVRILLIIEWLKKIGINERKLRPKEGDSAIDYFEKVMIYFLSLISKNIKPNYYEILKNQVLEKIETFKQKKINLIKEGKYNKELLENKKKNNSLNVYLNHSIEEILTEEKIINNKQRMPKNNISNISNNINVLHQINNDSNIDIDIKEERIKDILVNSLSKRFSILKQIRENHILLDPIEILSENEKEKLENYFNNQFAIDFPSPIQTFEYKDSNNSQISNQNEHYNFDKKDIFVSINNMFSFNKQIYTGYSNIPEFKRMLIVSHSGFILELFNVINKIKGLNYTTDKTHINNCSLTIIRVYCSKCNGICLSSCKECDMEFSYVLIDEGLHLKDLK